MYLVTLHTKLNILDCISDSIISECIRAIELQSRNIRILDYTVKSDRVNILINIINNIHSPTAYVAKTDEKVISDFIRQYKLSMNRKIASNDLFMPRYSLEVIDKI